MELLKTEKGNASVALSRLRELQNTSASSHRTVRTCWAELCNIVSRVCVCDREQVAKPGMSSEEQMEFF